MDSFSKRRPPKFSEPIDFNKINLNNLFEPILGSDYSYSNLLLDRFSQGGLFSSDWNTSTDHGPFNFTPDTINNNTNNNIGNGVGDRGGGGGSLYSSNLANAANGINNSNPFSIKGFTNYDLNSNWSAPRSCPPIGPRESHSYNPFSLNHQNHQQVNNHNSNNNQGNLSHHNLTNHGPLNNSLIAASSNLNALSASYVPPRVRRRNPTCTECVFCKNNGQPPSYYRGHILKDPEGKILCPVLRGYNCPICRNGGGDKAHTLRYCPMNKPSFWQKTART